MNRGELRTEMGYRFDNATVAGKDTLNRLLDTAYGWVWSQASWRFKKVSGTTMSLAASDAATALPTAIAKVTELIDDVGDPVQEYDSDEFEDYFRVDILNSVRGRPDAFTIVDDGVGVLSARWNKINDAARNYTVSGERGVHHRADGSTLTVGLWNSDLDTPVWPAEHHMLLVYQAALEGLILANDPSYAAIAALRDEALGAMEEDLAELTPPLHFPRRWA